MRMRKRSGVAPPLEQVAGNGLLHRRALLGSGIALAGALGTGASLTGAAAEPLTEPEWSLEPGAVTPLLQTPSRFEKNVVRNLSNPKGDPRTQHARTPHQMLNGTITPNSLHFTILHSGIPDIDPEQHRLVIHGMVKQPLEYTVDALMRYPMVTRKYFVECGGNSAPMFSDEPVQAPVGLLHGLASCAEWTGVPLSTLLDEAGADPKAKWMLAEGADSLAVTRSVPMKKAYEDAMIALYQNGERIMPGNGYPMRLLLPFLNLKTINQRKGKQHSADAILNGLRGPLMGLTDVQAFPFLPPAIAGVSSLGGFTFEVQDEGGNSLQELYNVTQKLTREGNTSKDLSGLFSPFTANDPQFVVNIDREKARSLQVPIQQITDALQVYMGSAYINDFDFNNRSYRVYVQAAQSFRRQPRDIRNLYVRSDTGAMIPLDNVVHISEGNIAAGDHPLQPLPLRRNRWRSSSRPQLWPGHSSHGCRRQERLASRVQLFVVWPFAGGDPLRRPVSHAVRAGPAAGLPHAVGAI